MPIHNMKPQSSINFQDTNAPDFNLERDVSETLNPEVILGMEAGQMTSTSKFQINLSTIIISAIIFLATLAWFDFIQSSFYSWIDPDTQIGVISPSSKLWYSILITFIVLALVILIYYYSRDILK